MRRVPALAFAALVAATIAAFFIIQHLKVSDPLIASPRLVPGSINPRAGRVCELHGRRTSFRRTTISFFLPDRSDTTGVSIINDAGVIVRRFAWRSLQKGKRAYYVWNGREQDGSYAPAGTYYLEVALQQEGRSFSIPQHPITIITSPPHAQVTKVAVTVPARGSDAPATTTSANSAAGSLLTTGAAGATVISPPHGSVTIHFRPAQYRQASIVVYRSSTSGRLTRVTSFRARGGHGTATWNGMIDGHPAPPGVYMIGVQVVDAACNLGSAPTLPVPTGSTAGTGVTINYLSVEPQLEPVQAGSQAAIYVDSHGASYTWALRRAGATKALARGTVKAGPAGPLNVRVPGTTAGLDVITVKSGGRAVTVPVVVSSPHGARVLVVLPALTWQGNNPVDDSGDGIPDTLGRAGDTIALNRPLVNGLPAGFDDEVALLHHLQQLHMDYQLTTDVALAAGTGPSLAGHPGVILDGPFTWIPARVATALHRYVAGGGRVLSLGERSLQATAPITPGKIQAHSGPTAGPARPLGADPFGAHHGAVQPLGNAVLTTFADPLGIFGQASAFTGYTSYQPIAPPTGSNVSIAGVAAQVPAITGFQLGHGTVVEVGLSGFGSNLQGDEASRELLSRVWKLFTGK